MTAELLNALRSSACYPYHPPRVDLIETHISWVLLTGEFAYKLKKPVNFGFLDFSTLAKRKYYCEEELRLNSRFSTGLYLEVVAITGSEAEPRVTSAWEQTDNILDYAVKMRQFDQDLLLEKLARDNALDFADVASLAKKLAHFHLKQAARLAPDDNDLGTAQSIANAALDNFAQIMPHLTTDAARHELLRLRTWTAAQLDRLHGVFTERRAQGFVRECHGDLHLRNIARLDGDITFFDCIEFNAQFRWIDVQSELAFLLMDMEEKQLNTLSNRLLNTYLEYSGDYQGLAVLQFYKVYRAMVRAKVAVLKLAGAALIDAEQRIVLDEYLTYIRLAQVYCGPRQAFIGLMHGVSGTGKSTVAATLAGELDAIRIRSDVERKRLFGLSPDARSEPALKTELYSDAASAQTFVVLQALAGGMLELGYPVLVDATFIAEQWRKLFLQLARRLQVPFVLIDCQATEQTILQRLAQRQASQHDASEAGIDIMRSQLESIEPFTAAEQPYVLAIDTQQAVSATGIREYLERSRHPKVHSVINEQETL